MAEGRKRKSVFEVYEKKRKASEERNKTRVFLGDSFTRWRALKAQVGLPTDASVAKFLLDRTPPVVESPRGNIEPPAATMSSVQALRDFINERLAAAAGEIFTLFQQTIVQYEEEVVRQHNVLQISGKPGIRFHRAEGPQRHAGQQKTSSSLQQEEREASPIKEEEGRVEETVADGERDDSLHSVRDWTSQRLAAAALEIFTLFEQTVVQCEEEIHRPTELRQHHDCGEEQLFKQETNYCGEPQEPEPPQIKEEPVEPEPQIKEEPGEPEPPQIKEPPPEPPQIKEEPELYHVTEHLDSEPTRNVELKEFSIVLGDHEDEVPESENQAEGEKLLCEEASGEIVCKKRKLSQKLRPVTEKKKILCEICGKGFNAQYFIASHEVSHR